jgi:zinc finger protein
LAIHWKEDTIPFFENVMYITANCECSFRLADTMILTQKDPIKYTLVIENQSDLNTRVIRSNSGTIKIPEIGIMVEPGLVSESFITNIEGVLNRICSVVTTTIKWSEEDDDYEKQKIGIDIQKRIQDTIEGRDKLTIIIEDPFGNSAIISDNAKIEKLTKEEVEGLKTGMIIYDVNSSELICDSFQIK